MTGRAIASGSSAATKLVAAAIAVALMASAAGCGPRGATSPGGDLVQGEPSEADRDRIEGLGLETDLSKRSVDLADLAVGVPLKDSIPALTSPEFEPLRSVRDVHDEGSRGILVELGGEQRFYPFSILVWHEIVNETVGDVSYAVTF